MPYLICYEYAAKQAKYAAVNYRWAIDDSGRFLRSDNPKTAIRPDGEPIFWLQSEDRLVKQLSEEEMAKVRAIVASCPLSSGRRSPKQPVATGDLSRLSVAMPSGEVVFEVEDRCTDEGERFMAGLVQALMPQIAAGMAR